jgi:hypothetical protein
MYLFRSYTFLFTNLIRKIYSIIFWSIKGEEYFADILFINVEYQD